MLPEHISDVYKDILKEAGLSRVYMSDPMNAIQESLTGFRLPGLHLNIMKQTKQDLSKLSRLSYYTVRGTSGLMSIADDELLLEFRHMDGFHNHLMLFMSCNYMQDHFLQKEHSEEFLTIGDIVYEERLTDTYSLRTNYRNCVYSSIDSIEKKFKMTPEEMTFQVRLKFMTFSADLYKNGALLMPAK
jgi:hypothetical protein